MKVMILAAGLGTRLRPVTNIVSKPMVQMGNHPCMEYIVRLLARHGANDIMVNLHYLPEAIQQHFGDGSDYGVNITYSYERDLMGTAGGFKRVQDFFRDEQALIISGDALTDINLERFLAFHKGKGGIATLGIKRVVDPTLYGVVVREGDRIIRFQEKPKVEEAISNLANTGIYLFEPEIFEHIPANTFYDFGKQVFPELLAKGEKMYGYTMEEYWCDVGDLNVYREAHYDMLNGLVNVELPGKRFDGNVWLGERVTVHSEAVIVGPVLIGNDCKIEKGARIYGPTVLGKNSVVGSGAVVKRGILWDNVQIGDGTELTDTIVASGCTIPGNLLIVSEVLVKETVHSFHEVASTKE